MGRRAKEIHAASSPLPLSSTAASLAIMQERGCTTGWVPRVASRPARPVGQPLHDCFNPFRIFMSESWIWCGRVSRYVESKNFHTRGEIPNLKTQISKKSQTENPN